jgi:hypothetical protein
MKALLIAQEKLPELSWQHVVVLVAFCATVAVIAWAASRRP